MGILKTAAKILLKRSGLFPMARVAYRRLGPSIALSRRKEIQFYKEIIAPSSLVFDIGANLGQKSDVFLAAGFRMIVVEPNLYCQESLRFQFKKRAFIVQKAVGRKCGRAVLYAAGSAADASLLPDWHQHFYGNVSGIEEQVVEITTLDAMISEFGRPEYIKIDVEGFEREVLLGLTKPVPLISFEFHAERVDAVKSCIDHLSDLGSLVFRPTDMTSGQWLGPATNDCGEIFSFIKRTRSNGDLYVWIT